MSNTEFQIIRDSREQRPYSFDGAEPPTVALPTGDYSLRGYEDLVTVERKELSDFVKSVITDRKRFLNVVKRMELFPFRCLVLEGSLEDFTAQRYGTGAHPESILGALISLVIDHAVPVFICGDRQHAAWLTYRYLTAVHERIVRDHHQPLEKL